MMIHLPRSFLLATSPGTTTSFLLLPKTSTSSAHQIIPLMDKCRALHHFPGTCITSLPIRTGDKHRKCSMFKLKNIRLTCAKMTIYTKVRPDIYTTIRSFGDGFKYASNFKPLSRDRFLNCVGPVDIFGNGTSASGVGLNLTKCRAISNKSFSQEPSGTNEIDVGSQNTSTLQGFNKLKKEKAFAVQRKIRAADSSISNNVETETSREQQLRGWKDDRDLGSSVLASPVGSDKLVTKVDGKKKPESKKGKKQKSSAESQIGADSSENSKDTSEVISASNKKRSPDLMQFTELDSSGDTPAKVAVSSPTRPWNSSRKGNSVKAAREKLPKHTTIDVSKVNTRGQMPTKMLYPPTGKSVVVVESVTKARVIQGYLGDMFEVLPSYGHVRDLAARSGSVRPDDDFSMVWEVPSAAWTHLKSIKVALNGAKNLVLASDPDREGEAIAWHIMEMLQQQDALCDDVTVARVVFHEITESSIKNALTAPRIIDVNLVHAYLARRALDYLIGFNVSPLLWKKLPGCQSAGRVQSAALALICDREMEIDEFKPQEYWTIDIELNKKELGSQVNSNIFPAHLTHFDSKKLNQFSISSQTQAKDIEQQLNIAELLVLKSKVNKTRKNPPTPYITSTLQQDAANKLNFSSTYTMKLAQKLYEGVQLSNGRAAGLITYTRTDGLHISDEAVNNIRSLVIERYGQEFASGGPQKYFKKVKNAQEAHEAIRPTDISRLPSMLTGILDEDSLKLYTLIWRRTVACQMEPATIEQIQIDLGNAVESIVFRSSCSRIVFPGYQSVFKDVEAEPIRDKESQGNDRDDTFKVLRSLKRRDPLYLRQVQLKEHYTQPPPRYSEGSLVKKLEELGIGRPSTYASTIKVLQDRNYVTVKSRVLHPEFRGRMVSAFLCHHFSEVTDYSFTADMETELDNVSAGLTDWKGLLRDYWTRFSSYCGRASNIHVREVEKMLEKKFGNFLFTSLPEQSRVCPSCMEGTLIFKVSRFGAGYFIGCDQHPKCKYIAKTLYGGDEEEEEAEAPQNNVMMHEPKVLGVNPGSGEKVILKNGPFGFYVQLGEDRKGYQPKRVSVSHIKDVDSISLEDTLELMRYPIILGNHPDDGRPITLKLSKVGFVVQHRRSMATVPKNLNTKDITLEKALKLLSGKDVRRSGRPKGKPKVEEDF